MADRSPPPERERRRWINIGEIVAVAGLIISGLALWNSWGRSDKDKPVVVEAPRTIPLALRGTLEDGGKALRLAPVETGHALDEIRLTAAPPASGTASFGSEPVLSAAGVEDWLAKDAKREGVGALTVAVTARYIEQGQVRAATQRYRVSYGWKEGGLLGGRALRLTGWSRI